MFQATMRCHLWDLVDERIDDVLDRLKGEAGITGISVPLVCPPVEQLRPHKGVSPRTFRSRGGIQFQPRAEFYANTRLRPVVAEWLRKSNPLPQVAEACAKRGLTLRGEINCCHSPVMVEKYPFAAVKDVFGEVNPEWLCPANADVVEYNCALAEDLSDLASLEVQDFRFPRNASLSDIFFWGTVKQSDGLNADLVDWLRALCFCESCRQGARGAGIAILDVQREVAQSLEHSFHTGEQPAESIEDFLKDHENLEQFIDGRTAQVAHGLKQIRDRSQPPILLEWPDTERNVKPEQIVTNRGGLIARFPTTPNFIGWVLTKVQERLVATVPIHVVAGLSGYHAPDGSSDLVRSVSEAAESSAAGVIFDSYGQMPMARLDWIRQAVRKAQRDAE